MTGRFIVFDGMDGAGKSTAIRRVSAALQEQGREVLLTREPGGNPIAESIRACLLQSHAELMPAETELLLVFAARAAHLQQTVYPALQAGRWVLCDRFVDSSYVYQGVIGGVDAEWISALEQRIVPQPPDLTVLLDLPPEQARERMRGRDDGNRFDSESLGRIETLRSAFQARLSQGRGPYVQVSAAGTEDEVAQSIMAALEGLA